MTLAPAGTATFPPTSTSRSPRITIVWPVSIVPLRGLPFVALSTTSVVMQRWLHDSGLEQAKDPAFLYGLSNAGALLALISYPLVVEPAMDVKDAVDEPDSANIVEQAPRVPR